MCSITLQLSRYMEKCRQKCKAHIHTNITMREGLTVHGHFINLCTIILLDVSKDPHIVVLDKVDGNSPPTVPP